MKDKLKEETRRFILRKGADLVGVASVDRFVEAPEGTKPQDLLPKAKSVVSFALHIPDGIVDSLPSASYQAQGYVVMTEMLNELGFHLAVFLEKRGYKSRAMPASYGVKERRTVGDWPNTKIYSLADFSHRHAAEKAGLGQIGKNNLLITPKFGPRVRLQSVITTASLKPDPMIEKRICICKKCLPIESCPAKALSEYKTDYYKCSRRQRFVLHEGDPNFEERDMAFAEKMKNKARQHPLEWSSELIAHTDYGSTCCGICLRECVIGIQSAKKRLL
jgi:epoxyqueuosine reductase